MSSAFRITQRSVAATAMGVLSDNLARLSRIQERLSSGRQIGRPSDSPSGTISALRLRSDLRKADQYQRASDDGIGWLSTADVTFTALRTISASQVGRCCAYSFGFETITSQPA